MMEMMKEMDFRDPANMADMMNGFQAGTGYDGYDEWISDRKDG